MTTNNKDAFRDYLQLEKKYSPHTINAYLNDISYFECLIRSVLSKMLLNRLITVKLEVGLFRL